jgi:hypothetical protein
MDQGSVLNAPQSHFFAKAIGSLIVKKVNIGRAPTYFLRQCLFMQITRTVNFRVARGADQ